MSPLLQEASTAHVSPALIRQMWENGPFRKFSRERFSGAISYQSPTFSGFAGSFVCARCESTYDGVYQTSGRWICGGCRFGKANFDPACTT
jgi:hypothetical protein